MAIRIDQPQPFDLVGDLILIAGVSTAFEGTVNVRVSEGHDEVTGFFTGGSNGIITQFQFSIDVAGAAFTLDRVFVEVFEVSAKDGSEINKVIVPVILGSQIREHYVGYREHTVVAGDTLSAIAQANYADASKYPWIVRANPTQIADPDLIFPGQVFKIPVATAE